MDVESLLRDALDLRRVDGEPGIGFEQRVIGSLSERRRRPARFVPALVGLAAALALTAVVLPWYLGSRSGPASVASASSSPSPTASPTPSVPMPSPTTVRVPTTHAKSWGLEFDYPTAWKIADAPPIKVAPSLPSVAAQYLYSRQVFGYVGTQTPATVCTDPAPVAGGGERPGVCSTTWSLGLDDVVLRFQKGDITGENVLSGLPAGVTMTTVGGLPAWFNSSSSGVVPELPDPSPTWVPAEATGADMTLVWHLPGNQTRKAGTYSSTAFRIVAAVRGPDEPALEAQVRALVASIKYDPVVLPLPSDPGALQALSQKAIVTSLGDLDAATPAGADCFPRTVGSRSWTITVAPDSPMLSKPLPVVCTVAIAPNILQTWTLTLTVTWTAASDRKAGTWVSVGYISQDGQGAFGNDFKTASDEFPYEMGSGKPG